MPYVEGAPDIPSLDDLMTDEEFAEIVGASRATIVAWRYGRKSTTLPYVRIGDKVFISKAQAVWWINQMQKSVDPRHVDFAKRIERGKVVGRRR